MRSRRGRMCTQQSSWSRVSRPNIKAVNSVASGIARAIVAPRLGRARFQQLFQRLHDLSLRGMNIGAASDFDSTGEGALLEMVRRNLRDRDLVVVDGGANIGDYARLVRTVLGSAPHIICVEPSAVSFEKLQRSLGGDPHNTLVRAALSDADGQSTLYGDAPGSSQSSLVKRDLQYIGLTVEDLEQVRTTTLSNLVDEVGIQHINLLKLDIEGNELNALLGARDLIARGAIDVIQFEFGGTNVDSRVFLADFWRLLSPAYRMHRLLRDGLLPLDYDVRHEIFDLSHYVAVRSDLAVSWN